MNRLWAFWTAPAEGNGVGDFGQRRVARPVGYWLGRISSSSGGRGVIPRGKLCSAVQIAACIFILQIPFAHAATNAEPSALWENTARVTTGFGYRENVLRSSVATENSGFFNASADASFLRLADSGAYLTFFLLGDHTQYFDTPSVDYEQFFSGTAQIVTPMGTREELGAQFNYLYQHQILDVSETEAVLTRVLVSPHPPNAPWRLATTDPFTAAPTA
jgi:hypothetical protein